MSITAKQYLLKQLGNELGDSLSANDLQIVQDKLNNILSMYEVEDIEDGQIDGEADDFLNAFLDAKEIEGRSQKTIKHYRYIITKMMKDINVPIRRITVIEFLLIKNKIIPIGSLIAYGDFYCCLLYYLS